MAAASVAKSSLPVSRGSVVDSELSELIHQYPNETRAYLQAQFSSRRGEFGPEAHSADIEGARVPFHVRTHYQETYIPKPLGKIERPSETKRRYVAPQVPMERTTRHQEDFVKIDPALWQQAGPHGAHVKANNETQIVHDRSWAPDDVRTSYQEDFPQRPLDGKVSMVQQKGSRLRLGGSESTPKMQGASVTKTDYQPPWLQQHSGHHVPAAGGTNAHMRFGELPSFASLIFPMESKSGPVESTTRQTFKDPHSCVVPEPAKPPEANLRLSGEQEFLTTQRQSYPQDQAIDWNQVRPNAQRAKHQDQEGLLNGGKRGKLHSETQFASDYKPYALAPRPQFVRVSKSDFNLFDRENAFANGQGAQQSVTVSSFKGHDVREHPVPKSCKKETEQYAPPEVKFGGETVTHSDFQPIDLSQISGHTIVKKDNSSHFANAKSAEFAGKSVTKEEYKDWSRFMQPRVRHGDLLEVCNYMPPAPEKAFLGQSEMKEVFVPKPLPPKPSPDTVKPSEKSTALWDEEGNNYFQTVYRKSYLANKPKFHLSKGQAEELKKELKMLRSVKS